MGWCGVGAVIRESKNIRVDLLELYLIFFLDFSGGGEHGPLGGKHTLVSPLG